jgi:hypothetical protein
MTETAACLLSLQQFCCQDVTRSAYARCSCCLQILFRVFVSFVQATYRSKITEVFQKPTKTHRCIATRRDVTAKSTNHGPFSSSARAYKRRLRAKTVAVRLYPTLAKSIKGHLLHFWKLHTLILDLRSILGTLGIRNGPNFRKGACLCGGAHWWPSQCCHPLTVRSRQSCHSTFR